MVPATFKHTLSLQDGIGGLALQTASGPLTPQTVIVTA